MYKIELRYESQMPVFSFLGGEGAQEVVIRNFQKN